MTQLNKKKIFFVTGSRAEFGQFEEFLKKLSHQKKWDLSLIITGSFLESGFENDLDDIIKSKIKIIKKIKLNIKKKNESKNIPAAVSSGIKKFSDFLSNTKPDYIILPCDRYELLCPAFAAFFLKIPIIHFYGGETSAGSFDDTIRNQVSILSKYHFVSNKKHQNKLINFGIRKKNIFNVGSLSLDGIKNLKFFTKKKLISLFENFFDKKTALVTFHPVTNGNTEQEFLNVTNALEKTKNLNVIFTGPNNDPENQIILSKINSLVEKDPKKYFFRRHLGRKLYFSLVKNVDFNLGNSSSLIYEVPSLKKFSINVGTRQKNRTAGSSVLMIEARSTVIFKLIKNKIHRKNNFHNPYYKKNSIKKIIEILKKL